MLSTVAGHSAPLQQSEKQAAAKYGDDATNLLPLPQFKTCASTKRPVLPPKWEATALMEDFFLDTLWYGKFVVDEDAKAFRFSVADDYGVDYDFLVTSDRRLYLLEGGDIPKSCKLQTTASPYTVPQREWLQPSASCVGQAPILNRDQQWWKNPSGPVGANWFWYDVVTGSSISKHVLRRAQAHGSGPGLRVFHLRLLPNL